MSTEHFIDSQRKGVNRIFALFLFVLSIMWVATLCDWAFNLGWGWDSQILWIAPPMMLFAVVVRFFAMAIFSFVESNY